MDKYIDMRRLGERVLLLRRRAALSQHELAHKAGIDVMTISRLEGGDKKRLEIEPLARLALALHVSTDLLLGLEESPADIMAPMPSAPPTSPQAFVENVSVHEAGGDSSPAADTPPRRRGRPRKVATLTGISG